MKDSTKKLIEELRASTARMHEEHLVQPASFVPPEERRAEFLGLAEYARAIDGEHPAVRATTKDDVMHLMAGALAWKQACPAMQRDADTVLQLVLWLAGMEHWRKRCERVDREAIASDLAEVLGEVEREVESLRKPMKREPKAKHGFVSLSAEAFQDGVEHQRKRSAGRLEEIRARAEAATEGPWTFDGNAPDPGDGFDIWGGEIRGPNDASVVCPGHYEDMTGDIVPTGVVKNADGFFMAHARTDIPDLLAEVERLSALVEVKDAILGQSRKSVWEAWLTINP